MRRGSHFLATSTGINIVGLLIGGLEAFLQNSGNPGGRSLSDGATTGARANRMMGWLSHPAPEYSVSELLRALPHAIETVPI